MVGFLFHAVCTTDFIASQRDKIFYIVPHG
jgi:hypothetical protein